MTTKIPNIDGLTRFLNSDKEFKLTKIGSKRENSFVGVGKIEVGDFSLHEYPETDNLPAQTGVFITGRGFSFLRTSPIVAITDTTETTTTFETEGGIYLLEQQ